MMNSRSISEIIIAIAAVLSVFISLFTGIRAFYVNEYRIDVLEIALKDTRIDIKEARNDIQELDKSVQRLLGAAARRDLVH